MKRSKLLILNLGLIIIVFLSCQSRAPSEVKNENAVVANNPVKSAPVVKRSFKIASPSKNEQFTIGDKVNISVKNIKSGSEPDSIVIMANNERMGLLDLETKSFVLETGGFNTGSFRILLRDYIGGKINSSKSISIFFKSNIEPENWTYQVVHTYPHDRQAYTQGLVYEDGYLYEGTGQRGKSSLRKIKPETGDLLASLNLPPDLFGEGISIFKDEIIQLTWTSGIGFVYDKSSFKFLRKFRYSTQGWGLTNNGTSMLMSDGSEKIFYIEPEYFTVISSIEVYDQNGPVKNLNELELIDGLLYANIYTSDKVAVIDPSTGKVLAYINFSGLLKKSDRHPDTDVLNGIAYDKDKDRLFVTGKNWPKLFEVLIVK